MPPHAISSGTISFGLVSVPVKLFSATQSKGISFNQLHSKDHARMRQQYVCNACGDVVERNDMVKGYEYSKGQYAIIHEEEIKALQQQTDQSIEIDEFVPIESIDPVAFDKAYLLGPDRGGHKPYRLLSEAMQQAGRGAVARFASRGRQQLVMLRHARGGLMMHTLYYADEVRGFEEIDLGGEIAFRAGELDLAVKLIDQLTTSGFDHRKYEDNYRAKVTELIDRKIAGQQVAAVAPQQPKAQIIDLMEALKASLAARGKEETAAASEAKRKPTRQRAAAANGTSRRAAAKNK